mgnify:CR=1 FL=1
MLKEGNTIFYLHLELQDPMKGTRELIVKDWLFYKAKAIAEILIELRVVNQEGVPDQKW